VESEEKAKVAEELLKQSKHGTISCRAALELARRLGVEPRVVGEVANEKRLKIVACQLGCF